MHSVFEGSLLVCFSKSQGCICHLRRRQKENALQQVIISDQDNGLVMSEGFGHNPMWNKTLHRKNIAEEKSMKHRKSSK